MLNQYLCLDVFKVVLSYSRGAPGIHISGGEKKRSMHYTENKFKYSKGFNKAINYFKKITPRVLIER